jgi:hypothetical protein
MAKRKKAKDEWSSTVLNARTGKRVSWSRVKNEWVEPDPYVEQRAAFERQHEQDVWSAAFDDTCFDRAEI